MTNPFQTSADVGPLLLIATVLLTGAIGGWLARLVKLPSITGNILGGVLIGPSCLSIVHGTTGVETLQPVSTFAMGLITVTIGGHLSYRRIHNAVGRIVSVALFESLGAVAVVVLVARLFHASWPLAALLGVVAAATAPGTIIALVSENRAKGTFVKTLLSAVAIDNIICICLFALVEGSLADFYNHNLAFPELGRPALHSCLKLGGSLVAGVAIGAATERLVRGSRRHDFSTVFVAILLCAGLSSFFGLSPLLTSLFFGVHLGNGSRAAERQLHALEPLEPLVYTCFFTLAGASLHLSHLAAVGGLCIAYLLARAIGKGVGAAFGAMLAGASPRIWRNLPFGFIPQAGVAVGLTVLLEGNPSIPREISTAVSALVLAAVTVNEIIGPFMVRHALIRAKEVQLDRPRLMEFMQEEFILVDLQADNKWDAIRQLIDFLLKTHNAEDTDPDTLYESVVDREKTVTTALGDGVAIPHGKLARGEKIEGVLGISREGIPFDAPDKKPVHIVLLIATPANHEDMHLQVLASLATMVSDEGTRERLRAALNANDAWEVIESEEMRDYNYFLEED